jgi:hypothetical protein
VTLKAVPERLAAYLSHISKLKEDSTQFTYQTSSIFAGPRQLTLPVLF